MNKKVVIYSSTTPSSVKTVRLLKRKLDKLGWTISEEYADDAQFLICIGGDGTFLEAVHKFDFPQIPIAGINTGHLGFFQDLTPDKLDEFIFKISQQDFTIQELSTVEATVYLGQNDVLDIKALNEIAITATSSRAVHLNLSIGGSFIERFSGDGIVTSSPAGSTAYNYSLGGSIVDPRLKLLQVTPIAPMNTTAYRSFTSSLMLPSNLSICITPDMDPSPQSIQIKYDGYSHIYHDVRQLEINYSNTVIKLIRFDDYDFWSKVKSKFL